MATGGPEQWRVAKELPGQTQSRSQCLDGLNPVLPLPRMSQAATRQLSNVLTGLQFAIDQTWDGQPIEHEPFTFHMQWHFQRIRGKPHKRVVKVFMEGPLVDDPPPPDELPGICANLWDYEAVELFFANDKEHYLEVEIGPHGHWLVLLLNGRRNPFNKGLSFDHHFPPFSVSSSARFQAKSWSWQFRIRSKVTPGGRCSKFRSLTFRGM